MPGAYFISAAGTQPMRAGAAGRRSRPPRAPRPSPGVAGAVAHGVLDHQEGPAVAGQGARLSTSSFIRSAPVEEFAP
jgi:hypothetical protein